MPASVHATLASATDGACPEGQTKDSAVVSASQAETTAAWQAGGAPPGADLDAQDATSELVIAIAAAVARMRG